MIADRLLALFGARFEQPEFLNVAWLLPAILLLYLLRRRASLFDVPFLPFWERVLAARRRPAGLLRRLLSAALQIAIFATAIVGVSGPYAEAPSRRGAPTLIVIDRTAPTAADAAAVSAAADALISKVASDGSVSIAAWTAGTIRMSIDGADASRARDALRLAPPPSGPRDPATFARILAATPQDVRTIVVTPFALPSIDGLDRCGVVVAGDGRARNGGLRGLRHEGDRVVATIEGGAGRTLTLETEGRALASAPAEAETTLAWPASDVDRARLVLSPPDSFPDDDSVDLRRVRFVAPSVLVVADGPTPELDAALAATGRFDMARSSRAAPNGWRAVAANYDLVVLIGRAETAPLPPGRYLVFAAEAPGLPWTRTGPPGPNRAVSRVDGVPWLRTLDPAEWEATAASTWRAEAGAEVLVEGESGPLVVRFGTESVRGFAAATAPNRKASTLPLLPAFPLMIAGMADELLPPSMRAEIAVENPEAFRAAPPADLAPAVPREAKREESPAAPGRRSFRDVVFGALALLLVVEWVLYHAGVAE